MFKTMKLLIIAAAISALCACGSTATRESTGQYLDSSAVTAKVKGRLVDMLGASPAFGIKVKTYKGSVQLSGFVNSETIKRRAGTIANNTVGVKRVQNDLIVK